MNTVRKETMTQITSEGVAALKKHNQDNGLTPVLLSAESLLARYDELHTLGDLRGYIAWINILGFEDSRTLVDALAARRAGV